MYSHSTITSLCCSSNCSWLGLHMQSSSALVFILNKSLWRKTSKSWMCPSLASRIFVMLRLRSTWVANCPDSISAVRPLVVQLVTQTNVISINEFIHESVQSPKSGIQSHPPVYSCSRSVGPSASRLKPCQYRTQMVGPGRARSPPAAAGCQLRPLDVSILPLAPAPHTDPVWTSHNLNTSLSLSLWVTEIKKSRKKITEGSSGALHKDCLCATCVFCVRVVQAVTGSLLGGAGGPSSC